MKNILSLGISGKKTPTKKLLNNLRFNFCYGNKTSFSNMENEIMKSFTSFNKAFNLNGLKKTNHDHYEEEDKAISLEMLKNKYLSKESENETDAIIKVIFREEVLNIKLEKEFENLILFITNCKKYNYPEYLTDGKYYKNKEIRNLMTNTNLLENLHQKQSPFGLQKEFEMKFKVQQLYNLRRGEKGEKLDRITEKEFEIEKYNYMNYLAETSTVEKMTKYNKITSKNENILNEFHAKNNLLENEEDLDIKQEAWKNHYIQYLQKLKKKEREESFGASKYEEPYFNEAIKKNVEDIFKKTESNSSNDNQDDQQENETFTPGETHRYTQNEAKVMNDGTNEPYPYHDADDYPIEEYLDTDRTAPGHNCIVYGGFREIGSYEPLPPKIDNYFDQFVIDTHKWGIFSSNVNVNLALKNLRMGMQNIFKSIIQRNTNNKENYKYLNDSFDSEIPQSLLHYYNLLPKWARDHPAIKMLVRGLEYYQPWISYREKINLLNMGLKFVIDRDSKYKEIYEDIYQSVPEKITLENLPSLMEHNEDLERNILQHPDDEATDDEEFEFFQSAEEVRAIEKQEEEERKLKKKEEGRAKRAAEEAKQAAAEGKVDKAAEEKKKKEEAEKKKKESEAAGEEGEEGKEEEEGVEEGQEGAEDESLKEEKMFSVNKRIGKNDDEKGDELVSIYDNLQSKLRNETADKDENENEDKDNEDDIYDNSEEGKFLQDGKNEIEEFRKKFREKKASVENKKSKINDIINDLRTNENLKIFENNVQLLRKNLEDNNIRFMKQREQEKLKISIQDSSVNQDKLSEFSQDQLNLNNDLIQFPLTLISSRRFNEDQKTIIKNIFASYINELSDKDRKDLTIELDENITKKTIEEAELEILNKISLFENDQTEKTEGIDISMDYKDSLKDDDLKVDESEELGLTDAYYKPRLPIDFASRKEDPIPFEYYINDDGFWDNYIALQKSKIDVKQINLKPFIQISKQIKKKEQF